MFFTGGVIGSKKKKKEEKEAEQEGEKEEIKGEMEKESEKQKRREKKRAEKGPIQKKREGRRVPTATSKRIPSHFQVCAHCTRGASYDPNALGLMMPCHAV